MESKTFFYISTIKLKTTSTMANRRMEYGILLKMANEQLAEYGVSLDLYKNEDGFYNLDIIHTDGEHETYAENYFEDELDELVSEAWHDTNAKYC